jgi:hypothetical protein
MRSKAKISPFLVVVLLLGTLATSASANFPDPTREATTLKPELEMVLRVPQEGIQNVGSSTLQIVTPTYLPIGSEFDLCFGFFMQSPDEEYADRVDVDMPDNWLVNSVSPNSVPPANGFDAALPPVAGVESGNVAFWQSTGYPPATFMGAWASSIGGTLFDFCVNVTIPDESGAPWTLPWNYIGDNWSDAPHSKSGTYGPIYQASPLMLVPHSFRTPGCPNEEKTYEFTARNSTNTEMIVDLDYAISSGSGTCDGPATVTIPAYGDTPAVVTYEAWNEVGTSFTCDITATDSAVPANTIASQLIMDISGCYWDPAGWQLEPNTNATPNLYSTGLTGTNPAVIGSVGYVFGGVGEEFNVIPYLQMYDPTLEEWTKLADLPNPRYGMVSGWIGGLIYAAGGLDMAGGAISDLQVYDPETNLWDNALPDMPIALGAGAGGVATCSSGAGECLFHVGGSTDDNAEHSTLETWEFNPSIAAWTQLDNRPAGSSPDGFVLGDGVGCGGKIYVGGDARDYHDFFVLDPTSPTGSQWSTLASIPGGAGAMTPTMVCIEQEMSIYLMGGTLNLTGDVFVYDILTDTWDGSLPQKLNIPQVGSVGWFMHDKLWTAGGATTAGVLSPMPFESLERFTCVIEKKLFLPLMVK